MKIRHLLTAAALALLVAGCETYRVATDYDRKVDLSAWHTYAWMQQEPVLAPDANTAFGNPINQRRVHDAIDAELAAKGLTRIDDPAAADVQLRYAIGTRDRPYGPDPRWSFGVGTGWWGHHGGFGSSILWDSEPYYVTEARLSVDMFNGKTREPAWHGTVSLDSSKLSGDAAEKQIRAAVHKLMEKYPPGSAPPPAK